MAKDRQTSWAAGELTPDLHGQTGTAAYRAGAKLLKNFLVTPQGTLINRSGSVWIATLGAQTSRLVPFLFSGDEPRLAQLYGPGNVAMRTPAGAFAESGADDTTGDTVGPDRATVLEALRKIRVAQCAGTLMLARTDRLKDLRRVSASDYELLNVDFSPPLFGSSVIPWSTAHNKYDTAIETSATGITVNAIAGDATHPPREWDYCVTRVVSIEDGNPNKPNQVLETLPNFTSGLVLGLEYKTLPVRLSYTVNSAGTYVAANVPAEIAVYGDWLQRIEVGGQAGDPWAEFPGLRTGVIVAHRVYRGRGGVYGYLGETTTRHFVDDGRDPDIANPPPLATNPFANIATLLPPVAVAFANDRRMCANIPGTPQRVFGSAVGNWSDFDEGIAPDDADALSFDLSGNEHQEIRHLLGGPVIAAFAEKSTFALRGSGDLEVLTPTSIAAPEMLSVGSAHYPAPLKADSGVIFFIEAKGCRPYAAKVDGRGGVELTDLSLLSSHLFEGHTIVDWAWARDPHQTLWAVRDDGKLLSLAYAPGLQAQAWALHEITDGLVEAVATLPVEREDLLYMVVNRGGTLMLERLAHRLVDNPNFACHLDCAFISNQARTFAFTVTGITGGGASPYGLDIAIGLSGGLIAGDLIIFPDANGYFVRATVDAVAGTDVDATVTEYSGDVLNVTAGHSPAPGSWGKDDTTIPAPGLADGTVVTAVLDGAVFTDLVVGADVTGNVTPPIACLIRIVGLPFVSQFQSLNWAQEREKQKAVAYMLIETSRSRGGAVGTDFDHLVEIPPRLVSDGYGVPDPRNEIVKVPVESEFSIDPSVVVEQSQPKPIKIVAIQPEYVVGG